MDVPDDILYIILEYVPDTRAVCLTCHRIRRIFTEIPDIAYWCSGRDVRWLLPKMVPDVWSGSIFELIRADNIDVLVSMMCPKRLYADYMHSIYEADAVKIIQYLHERYKCYNPKWSHYYAAYKIMDAMGGDLLTLVKNTTVYNGALLKFLYKRHGKELLKYRQFISHTKVSLELGLTTIYDMGINSPYNNIGDMIDIGIRTFPRPEICVRNVIKYGTPDDIKKYVTSWGGVKVTPVMIALSTRNLNPTVFRWLYVYSGADLPALAAVAARAPIYLVMCHNAGAELYPACLDFHVYMLGDVGDNMLEPLAKLGPDAILELFSRGLISYSEKSTNILAKFGVTLVPTRNDLLSSYSCDKIIRILRANPTLVTYTKHICYQLASELSTIDYAAGERLCAKMAAVPGIDAKHVINSAKMAAKYIRTA